MKMEMKMEMEMEMERNNDPHAWFHGKTRIKGCDMELGKIYNLRRKHYHIDLDLYKVIKKDDEKNTIKFAKLKIPAYLSYGVSKHRPKILTVRQNMIYGYEYELNQNRNTSVFREN